MPEYRRRHAEGAMYFFTLVTFDRRPLLSSADAVSLLRQAVREECARHPFEIEAGVILPDHAHFVWALPEGDCDYGSRIGRIKVAFTKAMRSSGDGGRCPPYDVRATAGAGRQRGYADVWQPRFWEHTIRDLEDRRRHLDYIHYNPVKHGYVSCPHFWPHSSFGRWVETGGYLQDWLCTCDGRKVELPDFADIAERVGE